ncbi:MAG: MotA/TolQ/ExbB proton channel family protein [Pseudomonadota bacterium]
MSLRVCASLRCSLAVIGVAAGATAVHAAEPASATLSPLQRFFDAGGPIIIILAVLAVLALGIAIVKFVQFFRIGVGRNGFVSDVVKKLRVDHWKDALHMIEKKPNPVARVMSAAVHGKADPKMDDQIVREEVTRVAQAQLDAMERGLALLSLIATIAPLLGLLGTVLGMIEAFQQMEGVGDRIEPAVLAGGIWEALLTTAAGLSVAIPAAVFFTWLQRSVDVEAQRMEDAATQVFTIPLYDAGAASEAVAA